MNRKHSTARVFALGLESLSDRIVPSVTIDPPVDGVLTITGDSSRNVVDITDDGTTVTVTCDDGDAEEFTGVTDIVVSLGSGNDEVNYTLTGEVAADTARSLDVRLGNGHDTFTGTFSGSLADEAAGDPADPTAPAGVAALDVSVYGMNGHDTLGFNADGTVGTGATLSVVLGGGNGKDVLDAVYGGVLLGELSVSLNGGNGKDEVSAEAALDATSTGTATIDVLGGNGKDDLTLHVTDEAGDPSTLPGVTAVLNGGQGKDFADVEGDVEVIGAKEHP
jgi:hypothetical protein